MLNFEKPIDINDFDKALIGNKEEIRNDLNKYDKIKLKRDNKIDEYKIIKITSDEKKGEKIYHIVNKENNNLCIFTCDVIINDKELFNLNFQKCYFINNITSFSNVQFNGMATSFASVKFYCLRIFFESSQFLSKITSFATAQFYGYIISFDNAHFNGEITSFDNTKIHSQILTSFGNVHFLGKEIYFTHTQFDGKKTYFENTLFNGRTVFSYVNFQGIDTSFYKARFKGNLIMFSSGKLKNINFKDTNLKNIRFENTEIIESNFDNSNLKSANFMNAKIKNSSFLNVKINWKTNLKKIKEYKINNNEFLIRLIKDQDYIDNFKNNHPLLAFFWKVTSNYGRWIWVWILWSIIITLLYSFIYCFLGTANFAPLKFTNINILTWLYYSVVTFTTLGFGDIVPINNVTAMIVMSEVLFGYIMLGGLISILATKIARRS